MFTHRHRTELNEHGFTVVENVLSASVCDERITEYQDWLAQLQDNDWPNSRHSLIVSHNAGNLEPTWKVRLATKQIFEEIWRTNKLLTSVDTVAIGRPPEGGKEDFDVEGKHWLHCDQDAEKVGLHAYQGAVYLEAADEDDWTFYVLKKSHKFIDEFYACNEKAARKSVFNHFFHFCDQDLEWFIANGCEKIRVAVPKGGMVLWDSRLIHANARPKLGRLNTGRWRFTVFVCMTPAHWATEEDIEKRKAVYETAAMTSHWPSQGVRINIDGARAPTGGLGKINYPEKLPDIATTTEVQQLCGYVKYNNDETAPGSFYEKYPTWKQVLDEPPIYCTMKEMSPSQKNQKWGCIVM